MVNLDFSLYPLGILFVFFFVLYSKWQFVDDAGGKSGAWHTPGFWMRFIYVLTCYCLRPDLWKDILLAMSICAPLWDIGINVIALHKDPWYIGTTAKTDRKLGKIKWIGYAAALVAAIVIKFVI